MELSLNCFVLGSRNTFTANVPKKYINESNLTVIEYTVSNFKEIIKNQVKHAVPDPEDPNSMELWLVDIDDGSLKNISTEKDIENKFNGKRMKFPVTDTPNKRIKLEDIGIGLIQDKTTEYLQELLCPFDEPVDFFEFLPGVMLTVGNAMKLYKGKKNQEMETSYMVDNVIRKMLKLADKYIGTFGLEWARNNKTNDFTTTTDK
ncbi:kinase-like domain-containing protein [Rhizophagus irregularis DAOM 181602=DAOM 197198]|nr:kinase-like domain-containing protein [Rhizophagus irregularis DAOM 181602=DAOM 197198]